MTTVAGSIPGLTGCLNSTNNKFDKEGQTVAVTRTILGRGPSAKRRLHIIEGTLTLSIKCSRGGHKTETKELSPKTWTNLEQLILNLDKNVLTGVYSCPHNCPSDTPLIRIQTSIGEKEYEMSIEAAANIPAGVAKLQSQLNNISMKVDLATCR